MDFRAHWSLKILRWCIKGCSFNGFCTKRIVPRKRFLVVFGSWESLAAMKMALSFCQGYPRNIRIIFLISVSVADVKVPQSYRFFIGEVSRRNRPAVSKWRPNFYVILWKVVDLEFSLMTTDFSSTLRLFPRPIILSKRTLLACFTQKLSNVKWK